MTEKFKDCLNKYLKEQYEENKKKHTYKDNIFHASEAGMCARKIFFNRTIQTEEETKALQIFQIGNMFHEYVQENIMKGECEKAHSYDDGEFKIVGRPDIIQEDQVVELKTTKDVRFVYEPKPEHAKQINFYLYVVGKNCGKVVYMGKNDFESREFDVTFSKELFDETVDEFRYVYECIRDKVDFDKIQPIYSPMCFYCKYKSKCFPKVRYKK